MSEYQYYEFRAVDRPLSPADQAELRDLSSRGRITATSFTNIYEWGDFRGDPNALMATMFDLHVYIANWGTRRFMMRVPAALVDQDALGPFLRDTEVATIHPARDHLVIDVTSEEEGGDDAWDDDGTGWLGGLAPLRDALLGGDLRLFYLIWLTGVEYGDLPVDTPEPLPGLGPLTGALETFAEFLRLDPDLVTAAAQRGAGEDAERPAKDIEAAIRALPEAERIALLRRLHDGDPHVGAVLCRRLRGDAPAATAPRRCVSDLQATAEVVREERLRAEQARKAAERERQAAELAKARDLRLKALEARGEAAAWAELEAEIEQRNGPAYDRAAQMVFDLRDLATQRGTSIAFATRLSALKLRHERKKAFLDRLARGGAG